MLVEEEFALQTRHEALRESIVQGRAYPTHRRYDTRLFEPLAKPKRRILHSLIRVVNQTNVGVSPPEGHLKSIYHELRSQMGCHRPADYFPRVDIQDEGQVEKALPGMDVGYVRRPEPVRSRCGEVSLHEIGSGSGVKIAAGGSLPTTADAALQTCLAHQSSNP